ncbi:protein of unknown function [Aminobacter niigataensis]|nr:protein of unknown function [Aminobacter niigataensis]
MNRHHPIASQRAGMAEMVVLVWLVEGRRLAGETKSTATRPIAPARARTCRVFFIGAR